MSVLPVELWDDAGAVWRPPLTTAGLEEWLRDHGLGDQVAVIDGPDIPKDPGTLIVVTWLPGAGVSTEGAIVSPGFQLRVIGPQGNRAFAQLLADRIDGTLVLRDLWPGVIGGRYVVTVRRSGGEPAHDRQDAANRAHYVCTYVADVETAVS